MTAAAEAAPAQAKGAGVVTTFTILETNDGGALWAYRGAVEARDRDHAERLFLGDAKLEKPRTVVALSAAAWKPHTKHPKVIERTETTDFKMPPAPVVGVAVSGSTLDDDQPRLAVAPTPEPAS